MCCKSVIFCNRLSDISIITQVKRLTYLSNDGWPSAYILMMFRPFDNTSKSPLQAWTDVRRASWSIESLALRLAWGEWTHTSSALLALVRGKPSVGQQILLPEGRWYVKYLRYPNAMLLCYSRVYCHAATLCGLNERIEQSYTCNGLSLRHHRDDASLMF